MAVSAAVVEPCTSAVEGQKTVAAVALAACTAALAFAVVERKPVAALQTVEHTVRCTVALDRATFAGALLCLQCLQGWRS